MFIIAQCPCCNHWQSESEKSRFTGTCAAFPDGIPDNVFANKFNHRTEYPSDNGIRFEQNPDKPNPHAG
jgi:hypothetical protein